jgi:hypothetical protein
MVIMAAGRVVRVLRRAAHTGPVPVPRLPRGGVGLGAAARPVVALEPLLWPSSPWGSGRVPPPAGPPLYDSDYYTNRGRATEAIRRDTPLLLECDPDYTVYAPDMVFRESLWGHGVLHGLPTYRRTLRCIRVLLRWSFRRPTLVVTGLGARGPDAAVHVWWRFEAQPRPLLGGSGASLSSSSSLMATTPREPRLAPSAPGLIVFEGLSVYQFDRQGRICSHEVTNIVPPPEALAHVQLLQLVFGSTSRTPAPSGC